MKGGLGELTPNKRAGEAIPKSRRAAGELGLFNIRYEDCSRRGVRVRCPRPACRPGQSLGRTMKESGAMPLETYRPIITSSNEQ